MRIWLMRNGQAADSLFSNICYGRGKQPISSSLAVCALANPALAATMIHWWYAGGKREEALHCERGRVRGAGCA